VRLQILHRSSLPTLFTLLVFWATGLAHAQTGQLPTMTPASPEATRQQLADFNTFLTDHPELAGQIQKDPSLMDNREFVDNHPSLQDFLQRHPEIRAEVNENPDAFMRQEDRYQRQGDFNITRDQLETMGRFLDSHPEVAEQLQKDPSLIDNREFVDHHPELKEFLAQHPEIRAQFKEHPDAFMHRQERFDDRDATRWQLASMNHFLDSHPEIAEQVRKDPGLLDNKKFVTAHPALQDYLQQHPEIHQEIAANANAFMREEDRYEHREDRYDHPQGGRDLNRGELASFHQFLGDHSTIADQLTKNPELAKNDEYMEGHPELQQYLQAHPAVRAQLTANPQVYVNSAQQFDANGAMPAKEMTPKAPALDPKPKQ
jgi:translation initiation factor 2 beta subunit (eIF-2beta)/eIF-5